VGAPQIFNLAVEKGFPARCVSATVLWLHGIRMGEKLPRQSYRADVSFSLPLTTDNTIQTRAPPSDADASMAHGRSRCVIIPMHADSRDSTMNRRGGRMGIGSPGSGGIRASSRSVVLCSSSQALSSILFSLACHTDSIENYPPPCELCRT
jgi:hypothetical protein